jgi:glutaredoxin
MRLLLKAIAVLVVAILIVSSVYVVFYTEPEESSKEPETDDKDDENQDNTGDEDEGDDDETEDQEYVRHVFIEEGTATTCKHCPSIAKILHELYDSDDPDFYYVSMVEDKNSKAQDRLVRDYNTLGYPTLFIDGGYEVIIGGNKPKSLIEEKISAAASRPVPEIHMTVTTEYDNNTGELTTDVLVENNENETYTGRLRVYITEIIGRWPDRDGNPHHFAFLDYAMNEDVRIESNGNKTFESKWDTSYPDVYPENLWIVAVIFSSESSQKYSDPPDNEYPFDAHYADAAAAARVVEGKLPPSIGIISPKETFRYIFGNEKPRLLIAYPIVSLLYKLNLDTWPNLMARFPFYLYAVIYGKITIKTNVEADAGVEKVEFIVKGRFREIKETIYEEPYEWTWHKLAFGKYTITVKVYDKEGKTATDSIDVIAFML